MKNTPIPSRRNALKLIAGVPLFPLGAGVTTTFLVGCNSDNDDNNSDENEKKPLPQFTNAEFIGMDAPSLATPANMATTYVASALKINFSDGSSETAQLAYEPFFITGDTVPDGNGGTLIAGGYVDIYNQPIMDRSVSGKERQFFSDCPDGASLLTLPEARVPGVQGNTVFAVVQFEYTSINQAGDDMYGRLPSPIAVLTLEQNPSTGKLTLVKYHNVDTRQMHGLWITCGASLSPWNTHLSSEEYEPDATVANDSQLKAFSSNTFGDENRAKAYHYGHLPEIIVNPDGTATAIKHYCTGRISKELVQVMPDNRTVLMGDDATNGGLFMFIADRPKDLSSGTLYVAKWHQTSGIGPGAATLTWINLGHATSAEIERMANLLNASDIMDVKTTDPVDPSYTKIPFSGRFNWIKIHPGMEKAAAFLETHRYAAYKGGSLGFTKMEGTTVNIKDKIAYSAMASIGSSMLNGSGDIQVQGPNCGAVYALNLKGGQLDTGGIVINSEWIPVDMQPPAELIGVDLASPDNLGNRADADHLANPDNIKFSEKLRTLFIGEDSGTHVNNFLWAYNVDTKKLSRIMSCPAGAESTGLHAADEVHGWTYIMSNFQHPGDWGSIHNGVKDTLTPLENAQYKDRFGAAVGYLTATPSAIKLQKA